MLIVNHLFMVTYRPHYNVNLKSIAVNGKNIPIDSSLWTAPNARGTIIDSGTTLSYFADGIYDQIVNAVSSSYDTSYHLLVYKLIVDQPTLLP
jgi:hypothetical protein